MGRYHDKSALSRWESFWNSYDYEKEAAMRDGSPEAKAHYNDTHTNHKITAEDEANWEEYGALEKPDSNSPEATAKGATKYEIERAKFWDEQTMAARKKAEELLANQPDYTIPESVQGYVGMMTDIGNLLGNITPGGKSGYTIEPYKVKNSPGYGHPTSNEGLAKYVNSFASMVGNATPTSPTDSPTPPSGRDNRRFS